MSIPVSIAHIQQQQRKTVPGLVLTFGQGDVGQLGLGPDIQERGRPALVKSLEDVVDVCAGGMHTICLTKNGTLFSFGCDDEGALGREATDENSFEPKEVSLPGPVIQVTAGDSHSAALLDDGRVFAWGSFRVNIMKSFLLIVNERFGPKILPLNSNFLPFFQNIVIFFICSKLINNNFVLCRSIYIITFSDISPFYIFISLEN